MGASKDEVYILPPGADASASDEEWIRPRPASEVVRDAVRDAVDDPPALEDLDAYVGRDELAALFRSDPDGDGPDELTFEVDAHAVTVHRSGEVDVTPPED